MFLGFSDFYPIVQIPLSALYDAAGLFTLAKGIKNWRDTKRNRAPKEKRPMNKNINRGTQAKKSCCARCGIDLSNLSARQVQKIGDKKYCDVCGQVVLREVDNMISHKVESQSKKKPQPQKATVPDAKQSSVCARCKKAISENQIVWIGSHRFCRECAKAHVEVKKTTDTAEKQRQKNLRIQKADADRKIRGYWERTKATDASDSKIDK